MYILTILAVFVDIYLSSAKDEPGSTYGDVGGFPNANDNGYMAVASSLSNQPLPKEDSASFSTASDPSRVLDPRLEVSKRPMGSISALKELVKFFKFTNLSLPNKKISLLNSVKCLCY